MACISSPAPLGEALVVVQTDASIPRRVSRLRIDLYGDDGALLETRELSAASPRDWPISFSVVADRDAERFVTVRLRAYPEGHVVARADLPTARVDASPLPLAYGAIQDACAAAPTLQLGQPLTLRRGERPITTVLPYAPAGATATCTLATASGSAAAKLEIPDQDLYRVEIVAASPDGSRGEPGGDTTLALRSDCALPTTQLACNDDVAPGSRLSSLTMDLGPGTYWVVTGGADPAPADLTLLASRVNAAAQVSPAPPPVTDPGALEPSPGAAIDRVVRLRLEPGERGTLPITLFGECFGTAADMTGAQTCVDQPGARVPVDTFFARGQLARAVAPPPAPWHGDDPVACTVTPRPPSGTLDAEACIPGGALLMGDRLALTDLDYRTQPERMRVVAPFLLDVYEVSVGRVRDAIRRGFVPAPGAFLANDGPLEPVPGANVCTWNQGATPDVPAAGVDREHFPLNCVTWEGARALCKFWGADLPTEDQWEYAATAAGRPAETQYPWGNDLPTCDRTVVERAAAGSAMRCAPAYGPTAVDDARFATRDVTTLGVVGLGGNVQEWLATGFYPYTHAAWERAGLRSSLPAWADADAPRRATRGGDWATFALFATASARRSEPVLSRYDNVGFRCARPGR